MAIEDAEKTLETIKRGFEEFKETNDKRLRDIEKRGASDVLTEQKLARIEADLAKTEDANQKLVQEQATLRKAAEDVTSLMERIERVEAKSKRPGASADEAKSASEKREVEYKGAFFDGFVRRGMLTADEQKAADEYKTLYAGNETLGGYYLAPATMSSEIIKQIVLQSPVRSIARTVTIGTQSYKAAKRTGTFAATRVGELGTRAETTGYATGQVEINAPELFAEVHLSTQLIEDQFFDIEGEMALEFSEQFAVAEGSEFVNGTGVNKAEGFMQNATVGFQVSGTAATIADANGQGDGLVDAFYKGLKTAYAKNATWVMNRQTLGSVRKLKDAQKQYIWQPGVAANVPNTILGAPYLELPDMPNEGANNFPIAVGDFYKAYRVIDRVQMQVLRDPYTLSANGQILYRARKRVGGAVVLPEAIVKLKCST
jgi:HK97 family phage major capsid protein